MNLLWAATLLTIRIVLSGSLWMPATETKDRLRRENFISRIGRVIALGVVINLLPILMLGQVGCWTQFLDWAAWAASLLLALWKYRARGLPTKPLKPLACEFVAVFLTVSAVLVMPARSEWLAGGWDPGIYQNNAVAIATRDGLGPHGDTIYARMTQAERELISTSAQSYHEIMPGIPIRIRDGSLPLYFFQLTPVCGAWFYRLGGMALLTRLPGVLSLLGVWVALGLFSVLRIRGWRLWCCAALWIVSPVWWYHQAVPTSETLYMLLMLGGIAFYLQSVRSKKLAPIAAGLCIFAAVVNHFNFMVVGGVLVFLAACSESISGRRPRLARISFCIGSMLLGGACSMIVAKSTMLKLHEKDNVLWLVIAPFAVISLLSIAVAWKPAPRKLRGLVGSLLWRAAAFASYGLAGLIVLLSIPAVRDSVVGIVKNVPIVGAAAYRFSRLVLFHGAPCFILAGAGAICAARDRSPSRDALRIIGLGFGLVLCLFLLSGRVAPIYPWALRRYVIVALPVIVIAQIYAMLKLADGWQRTHLAWRLVISLLIVGAVADGARRSVAAAGVGDYRGLPELLKELDSHVHPNDLVVADDPRWATPLLMTHGRDVLNGKSLWESRDPNYHSDYLRMLQRLKREENRRVLWLTSTPSGLGIYPIEIEPVSVLLDKHLFTYRTVVHSSRAKRFATKHNARSFSLYEWKPDAGLAD